MEDEEGQRYNPGNQENQDEQTPGTNEQTRTVNMVEDQCFKKQMEFKGGKLHQLISDQIVNSNEIYSNRYQGMIGIWYFFIDSVVHFENLIGIFLFILTQVSQEKIDQAFPIVAVSVNVFLMGLRNVLFELRQRQVNMKINNKRVEQLFITRKFKKFIPITWAEVYPGQIIQLKNGHEFPADCLLLSIQGNEEKCYVSAGPFDDLLGIVQKKSYSATSLKVSNQQKSEHIADMISGILKFEYNYFGYVQGSFKLNENPSAIEFDNENVVQRGSVLTNTEKVTCLVLNVGNQCIGSVFKDPQSAMENLTNQKLKIFVKSQRSFDKAYKQSILIFLSFLTIIYVILSFLSIYLASNGKIFSISSFEVSVMSINNSNSTFYMYKGICFLGIMLSTIPISFSNIIDLLVLMHTSFAEWDIDTTPANVFFVQPHATLAFGKVNHMFFSRKAIQSDEKQAVNLFYVGGHCYKNQAKQQKADKDKNEDSRISISDTAEYLNQDKDLSSDEDDISLDYLPNQLQFSSNYLNQELESQIKGKDSKQKKQIVEFFKAITLCHQTNVINNNKNFDNSQYQYLSVYKDEVASLEFVNNQDFKLVKRKNKMLTLINQGQQERYEELGVITTKSANGHFITISANRLQGQEAGTLFMKGSIQSLKPFFKNNESEFNMLNIYEQKFLQAGVHSRVYAKRQLTIDETSQLVIIINEGIQQTKENSKIESVLKSLVQIQLEILGILGLNLSVHFRNRVTIDDMILNGVKPWIISKCDENTHMTNLNSLRILEYCNEPLFINGKQEKIVIDQIMNALKIVTDRMASKAQIQVKDDEFLESQSQSAATKRSYSTNQFKKKKSKSKRNQDHNKNFERKKMNLRNVVLFSGEALQQITRDVSLQKTFMTLAYLSDMMIGSEIAPLQKQKLIKIAKSFIGEGEYTAAVITTAEDQFMIQEADICANLKFKGKSADFQAVVDVTLKDFSAISYLLFKHGALIQMRLSKAAQAFIYRSLIVFLIVISYMFECGFSAVLPFTDFYYYFVILFIIPIQILIFSTFYKSIGYDYLYRIYGHYKYNFSYSLVQVEFVFIDILCALFDWCLVYLIQELQFFIRTINLTNGGQLSSQGYVCYQEILLQLIFFFYFSNQSVHVITGLGLLFGTMIIGIAIILDDPNLIGLQELFTSPALILTLLFQFFILFLRDAIIDVLSKSVIKRYADLNDFYSDIEEKLSFEQYEDPEQQFTINQYPPLFRQINIYTLKNTLKLINMNMMKVPRNDQIDQIIDKINSEFSVEKRSLEYGGSGEQLFKKQNTQQGLDEQNDKQSLKNFGTQLVSGSINSWTLTLNDMNQETEYQENKNSREIIYVRRQMLVFILMTAIFSIFGLILYLTVNFTIVGIYYYVGLCVFTIVVFYLISNLTNFMSNFIMVYTLVVIFCYLIYTTNDNSLQPTGLLFVLGFVAGLNHSFIYPTMIIILVSDLVYIFFSLINKFDNSASNFENSFKACSWFFGGVLWSIFVYMQELEKKSSFVSGHKKVRYYQRLKQILNILIPSIVREKIRSGKKNFSDDEGVVTIIFIDISNFDNLVENYKGSDLINLLDSVYNAFDQLCDQYGLQKVETVGKTYVACGGLKTAEQKIEQRLLNRHHSVRVTDFAQDIILYVKTVYLKNGKHLEVCVGIHSGPVISGVVGETKPQFSLIGPTVNKTSRVCSLTQPMKCSISKESKYFLELYTNNLQFTMTKVFMKGIGDEPIFAVTKSRVMKNNNAINKQKQKMIDKSKFQKETQKEKKSLLEQEIKKKQTISDNGSNEEGSGQESQRNQDTHRVMINQFENQNIDQFNNEDNLSNKSDQIDDDLMNVFGFNDDINLDDRIIVQNPTENQIYNLVERPKYLFQFEYKDIELEFQHQISKSEILKTSIYMFLLIFFNKVIICNDIYQADGRIVYNFQFYLMFPIFILELYIFYKINYPNLTDVYQRTLLLLCYEICILMLLLTYQVKYIGNSSKAYFIELQVQLVLSIFFFMRITMLRYFIIAYFLYLFCWIIAVSAAAQIFYFQIPQFIIGQILYFMLLSVGIHHREMIQRKSVNYERILNVETNKTNQLLSKLVPLHMVAVIKNQKRHVDEFNDCTLLFTDMVKFTAFSKNAKDPREVVQLLSKLFSRFDQLCDLHNVYKVHTIGDCYVIMGYNGKIDKSKRSQSVVMDETNRVILSGLDMIDVINEIRDQSENQDLKELDMRIGIHTGRVIAGIIGSKVVRYDIFGEGVLIANKMESNGIPGKVCISLDSKQLIMKSAELAKQYTFTSHNVVQLPKIKKSVQSFIVEKRQESFRSQSDSASSSYEDSSKSSRQNNVKRTSSKDLNAIN